LIRPDRPQKVTHVNKINTLQASRLGVAAIAAKTGACWHWLPWLLAAVGLLVDTPRQAVKNNARK